MQTVRAFALLVFAGLLGMTACGGAETSVDAQEPEEIVLGPVDGHDLPGTDLDRVMDGQLAPDFSLESWIDFICDVPSMFYRRARGMVPGDGGTRRFNQRRIPWGTG